MRQVIVLALLLSGCVADKNVPTYAVSPGLAKAIDERDDQKCRGFGTAPGSEAYANCRLKLQEFARQDAAVQQGWERQVAAAQQAEDEEAMRRLFAAKPIKVTMPQTVRTNCVSQPGVGNTITTECERRTPVQIQ